MQTPGSWFPRPPDCLLLCNAYNLLRDTQIAPLGLGIKEAAGGHEVLCSGGNRHRLSVQQLSPAQEFVSSSLLPCQALRKQRAEPAPSSFLAHLSLQKDFPSQRCSGRGICSLCPPLAICSVSLTTLRWPWQRARGWHFPHGTLGRG